MAGNRKSAFSLIEIMVLLGIIAIMASIIIPNLITSWIHNHEADALKQMKLFGKDPPHFRDSGDNTGGPSTITIFSVNMDQGLVQALEERVDHVACYHGYLFKLFYPNQEDPVWHLYAWPKSYNNTGIKAFYTDSNGPVFETNNIYQRYSGTKIPERYAATKMADSSLAGPYGMTQISYTDGEYWYKPRNQ